MDMLHSGKKADSCRKENDDGSEIICRIADDVSSRVTLKKNQKQDDCETMKPTLAARHLLRPYTSKQKIRASNGKSKTDGKRYIGLLEIFAALMRHPSRN
jgi:hypothetical protein